MHNLEWPSLQVRRKQARLIFLFKMLNGLICIPNQYLPSHLSLPLVPDLTSLLNCKQEQTFIITNFYLEQSLIGTM